MNEVEALREERKYGTYYMRTFPSQMDAICYGYKEETFDSYVEASIPLPKSRLRVHVICPWTKIFYYYLCIKWWDQVPCGFHTHKKQGRKVNLTKNMIKDKSGRLPICFLFVFFQIYSKDNFKRVFKTQSVYILITYIMTSILGNDKQYSFNNCPQNTHTKPGTILKW